jgi:hypothetical protein
VNGGIALFQINDIGRDAIGIDRPHARRRRRTPIGKAKHTASDKAFGFVGKGGAIDAGLTTTFSGGFAKEHHGPNGFVIVLEGVNEFGANAGKIVLSGHASVPFRLLRAPLGIPNDCLFYNYPLITTVLNLQG